MSRRAIFIVSAALLALGVAGCRDPYSHQAQRGSAGRTPAASAATPASGAGTTAPPRGVARAFGELWSTWDWRTAAVQQRALARLATRRLAMQLRSNADSARIDASLRRDRPGLRGAVLAVDLSAADDGVAGIVVTREQSYTDDHPDLGGRHYRVYRVRLAASVRGWEVSTWQPQP